MKQRYTGTAIPPRHLEMPVGLECGSSWNADIDTDGVVTTLDLQSLLGAFAEVTS